MLNGRIGCSLDKTFRKFAYEVLSIVLRHEGFPTTISYATFACLVVRLVLRPGKITESYPESMNPYRIIPQYQIASKYRI